MKKILKQIRAKLNKNFKEIVEKFEEILRMLWAYWEKNDKIFRLKLENKSGKHIAFLKIFMQNLTQFAKH